MARSEPSLLTPRAAAAALGISYPTIKQWILRGKLKTVKTPGGHHRIPETQLRSYLSSESGKAVEKVTPSAISGRNQLAGKIIDVQIEGLLAKVVLAIGDQKVTSIITADAARDLKLKQGDTAIALIKATEVMIGR